MMKSYEIDFKQIFKTDYEFKYFAPGRINLIGEHVDYNGGHVLPIAINLGIYALVSKRSDKKFNFFSDNYYEDGVISVSYGNLDYNQKHSFANYPKAVLSKLFENGYDFEYGLNIYFYTTLPEQGGVSSSACIEVLTATILNEVYHLSLTPLELAVICRKAQTEYLGLNSGIMDQAAIALGKEKKALFLDTFMLTSEYVPYDLGDYSIVVCQTNKKREAINSKYKLRVRECERALDIIKNNFNVFNLCKIDDKYMNMIKLILPDETLYKRVLHVHNEENRVIKAYNALLTHDINSFANCLNESHESLRDLYEVSCKELNTIVDLARGQQGCIAARMTGAGFGGCAIALVHNDFLVEFKGNMALKYFEETGLHGAFFSVDACGGPRRLPKDADKIEDAISSLIEYGIVEHLIEDEDKDYILNQILALLHLDSIEEGTSHPEPLYMILDTILNYAASKNIIENSQSARDAFDTRLMGIFVNRPSAITKKFYELYKKNPESALEYFYHLSLKSNYIREDRISKNTFFEADTKYGKLKMSINIGRVEHDKHDDDSKRFVEYPHCLLCKEAVGYKGRVDYPSRENHRVIPIELLHDMYCFQYSPYPYFREHSIVLNALHVPLKMNKKTFEHMVSFVDQFESYFIGTNADLPIVGGGILNHEHFHTGRFHFPIEDAEALMSETYGKVTASLLKWPITVLRLESESSKDLVDIADKILVAWRKYDDLDMNIIANDTELHNAITPIMRKKNNNYVLDLALRNNRTSEVYPLGIFHPHEQYLHIKKENIGLFEVMGLAILPKRLKEEMSLLKEAILKNSSIDEASVIFKHKDWALNLISNYQITKDNINEIFDKEIGNIFMSMLDDCAVFKQTDAGIEHFKKFAESIK